VSPLDGVNRVRRSLLASTVRHNCARSGQTAGGTPLLESLDVRVGEASPRAQPPTPYPQQKADPTNKPLENSPRRPAIEISRVLQQYQRQTGRAPIICRRSQTTQLGRTFTCPLDWICCWARRSDCVECRFVQWVPFASCQFVDTTPGNPSRQTEGLHTPDAMACQLHFEQALPVISELE